MSPDDSHCARSCYYVAIKVDVHSFANIAVFQITTQLQAYLRYVYKKKNCAIKNEIGNSIEHRLKKTKMHRIIIK